ncbi:hypothetical protein SNEBB_010028 [Seison nebaliae]|nr:hypothetical protein SNEBB_010028 [Seison nebaliae]
MECLYTFYIYNYRGECIYRRIFSKPRKSELSEKEQEKLIDGLLISMKAMCLHIPYESEKENSMEKFTYATSVYRLHYFETLTKYKFILFTTLQTTQRNFLELLQNFYLNVFIEKYSKNYKQKFRGKIISKIFEESVNDFFKFHLQKK